MCLAIPGKVIEIKEDGSCIVDYETEKREAKIFTDDIKLGDYVIVSQKIIINKVPEEKARAFLNEIKNA
ncbi:HypC/HybG/HupF family hydrogenase formation chaperone [Candidatus Pacearchaeota archaeon]|nr:HypC/HybG/HupF family hydrogenase formation chaperone [Candidatus Pacearchaeota archaeon]